MTFFTELEQIFKILYGNIKDLKEPKQSEERTELEESGSLTSDCTAKPQLSKQGGTGKKVNIDQWNRTEI